MATASSGGPGNAGGTPSRAALLPDGLLGMLLFVVAEAMLFAGMISAFQIHRTGAIVWPPPDQPYLPVLATVFNTAVLLSSGACVIIAHRAFHRGDRAGMTLPMRLALGMGSFFVLFQGFEWLQLISQGLTLTSSALGSFFFLIVGMHALHAIGALGLLAYANLRLTRGYFSASLFGATEVLWFFVVGVWPLIFAVVYF